MARRRVPDVVGGEPQVVGGHAERGTVRAQRGRALRHRWRLAAQGALRAKAKKRAHAARLWLCAEGSRSRARSARPRSARVTAAPSLIRDVVVTTLDLAGKKGSDIGNAHAVVTVAVRVLCPFDDEGRKPTHGY